MKNATQYEKKIKKLLGRLKSVESPYGPDPDPMGVLMHSIMACNATDQDADRAVDVVLEEYVDTNELRASPPKDIVDVVGRHMPQVRRKADMLVGVLNAIYARRSEMSMDHMAKMPKRELRRHLGELGMHPFAAASMVLFVFGGHAIPVDEDLVESLEMGDYIYPGSDLADVQGFLERVITQRNAVAAHLELRKFVADSREALTKRREKAAEARRIEAERQAAEQAEKDKVAAEAAAKRAARSAKSKAAKAAKTAKKAARKASAASSTKTAKKTKTPKVAKKTARAAKASKAAKKTKAAGKGARKAKKTTG